jgi:hypothetical protein
MRLMAPCRAPSTYRTAPFLHMKFTACESTARQVSYFPGAELTASYLDTCIIKVQLGMPLACPLAW